MGANIKTAQKTESKADVRKAHDTVAELAKAALKVHGSSKSSSKKSKIPDLEAKINEITSEVPALDCLEKKVGLMNELNPELKSLVKDINEVTNDEDMKAAKKGGEAIKKAL